MSGLVGTATSVPEALILPDLRSCGSPRLRVILERPEPAKVGHDGCAVEAAIDEQSNDAGLTGVPPTASADASVSVTTIERQPRSLHMTSRSLTHPVSDMSGGPDRMTAWETSPNRVFRNRIRLPRPNDVIRRVCVG